VRDVNEQLCGAADYNTMVGVINNFIRGLIKKQQKCSLLIDDACRRLLYSDNRFTL